MKPLLKIRSSTVISTCLIIAMLILSSWTPVPEEKRIRFEFSKDDCSDIGAYRLIVANLESQFVTEYNSFNGRVETKFSRYVWHDYYPGERTRCAGSCYMWCESKFRIEVAPRSSQKKFNSSTRFTIHMYVDEKWVNSIKWLKLGEQRIIELWGDTDKKIEPVEDEFIIQEIPTEIPWGREIPQAKKIRYTGDE